MNNIFYISKYSIWKGSDKIQYPDIDFVPSLIKRRLTDVEKIGLHLAHKLEPLPDISCIIFASQFGEWRQTIKLIQQVHADGEMSPAGFSHSVHNAMPGLLTLINKRKDNYTTIAANELTIDCALVEAFIHRDCVLFIYAEEETPDFYKNKFKNPFYGHGCAFLVSPRFIPDSRKIHITAIQSTSDKCTSFEELMAFLKNKKELDTRFYKLKDAE